MLVTDKYPFTGFKNLYLKDGILLFSTRYSSNPFDSTEDGLYVDSNGKLTYSKQGTARAFEVLSSTSISPSRSPSVSVSVSPSVSVSRSPSVSVSVSPSRSPSISPSVSPPP